MKINMLHKKMLYIICIISLFVACKPRERRDLKFNYFQNVKDSSIISKFELKEYIISINDALSIQVISGTTRQDDALMYNLPSGEVGTKDGVKGTAGAIYQVDSLGFVNLPRVGKVKAAGLTKKELIQKIEELLKDEVIKPYVSVKLASFKVSVLGEVRKTGNAYFTTDKVTLLDAISEAGDLLDAGKRDDVLVMREKNGKFETYRVDLTKSDFINSPAFQMQQNDIIYIPSNDHKLKLVNTDLNKWRDLPMILSVITTTVLILNSTGIIRRN